MRGSSPAARPLYTLFIRAASTTERTVTVLSNGPPTLPAILFLRAPLFFLFRWRGRESCQAFALGGATLRLIIGAFMASVFFIAATTISGTVGALTIWVCAFGEPVSPGSNHRV